MVVGWGESPRDGDAEEEAADEERGGDGEVEEAHGDGGALEGEEPRHLLREGGAAHAKP